MLNTSESASSARAFADSGFTPQEWLVRADATHGKSKTYRRSVLLELDGRQALAKPWYPLPPAG